MVASPRPLTLRGHQQSREMTVTTACSPSCTGKRKRAQRQVVLAMGSILAVAPLPPARGFMLLPTPHHHESRNTMMLLAASESPLAVESTMISEESPTILTIDNLLSEDDIKTAMKYIEMECVSTATTSDYQEDIFRDGAEEEEDNHFSDAVERALSNGIGTQQNIPAEHVDSPLEQFLWVVTNHPNAMDQEDIVTGANFIQRRQARQKWESEGGRQLLELSMDEKPFAKAGKRYEIPTKVKDMLLEKILRRMMRNPQNWSIHDATIVKYDEGESQVPHVDPCDCTILVYLDDGATNLEEECSSVELNGGDTCFPVVGYKVPVEVGRVLLFFSSTPPPSGERDVTSIHHGGLVQSGRKVVAQIMLSFGGENSSISSWLETLTV